MFYPVHEEDSVTCSVIVTGYRREWPQGKLLYIWCKQFESEDYLQGKSTGCRPFVDETVRCVRKIFWWSIWKGSRELNFSETTCCHVSGSIYS